MRIFSTTGYIICVVSKIHLSEPAYYDCIGLFGRVPSLPGVSSPHQACPPPDMSPSPPGVSPPPAPPFPTHPAPVDRRAAGRSGRVLRAALAGPPAGRLLSDPAPALQLGEHVHVEVGELAEGRVADHGQPAGQLGAARAGHGRVQTPQQRLHQRVGTVRQLPAAQAEGEWVIRILGV